MADLAALERTFHALVTGRAPPCAATRLIVGGRVAVAERMQVYAHAYQARVTGVLAVDAPKLAAVLGPDAFAAMAQRYLRACPPRHWSLREAGDRLATFLAADVGGPAWYADLARLERARVEAFDAADAAPLTRDTLAALPAEAFGALRLGLVPSAQRVALAHAADEVWAAIEDGDAWTAPAFGARTVMVWRRELTVVHRTLDDDEARFLGTLAAGATFADACATLGSDDATVGRALALLLTALDGELLRAR